METFLHKAWLSHNCFLVFFMRPFSDKITKKFYITVCWRDTTLPLCSIELYALLHVLVQFSERSSAIQILIIPSGPSRVLSNQCKP